MADFHLVCINPFHNYTKGQMITDPDEVDKLQEDREHHFVRIAIPAAPVPEPIVEKTLAPIVKK